MGSERRCVFFFFDGWLGVAPTLINLARSLSAAGYSVSIFCTPTSYPDAGDLGPGVRVEYIAPGPLVRVAERVGRFRGFGRVADGRAMLAAFGFTLRSCYRELRTHWRTPSRTVYVGVDSRGATAAAVTALVQRKPCAFLSLELRLTREQLAGLRGMLGRWAFRRAACVIVQGQDRLDVLVRQLGWKHDTVFFLPNGPLPDGEPAAAGANFLRARLGISPRARVALQAGAIDDATCSRELARGFAPLTDWLLVFHERHRRSPDEPYLRELREANGRNLLLSLEPVSYQDVGGVYAAADVGLAFYRPSGPDDLNFSQISSSGKLPHYLQLGKPVLVCNLPYMVKLVEEFECGVVIDDPTDSAEIGRGLERIWSRYDEFSRNARVCYEQRFDFDKAARRVIEYWEQDVASG